MQKIIPKTKHILDLIRSGKAILFLGQYFVSTQETPNVVNRFFTGADSDDNFYETWLASQLPLSERMPKVEQSSCSFVFPDEIRTLSQYFWPVVVTSAFDLTPRRLLDQSGANVQQHCRGVSPNSGSSNLYRLYGKIDSDLHIDFPPSNRRELNARRQDANAIIGKISEIIDPYGALFIDGWSPQKKDWLQWSQLLPLVSKLTDNQVFIFGLPDEDKTVLEKDDDFSLLLEDGVIVLVEQRLGKFLDDHALDLGATAIASLDSCLQSSDVVLRCVSQTPKEIPSTPEEQTLKDIRFSKNEIRRFEDSFMPLMPLTLSLPVEEHTEERARAFRNFLMKPQFEQAAAFVFRRPSYETLLKRVREFANKDIPQDYTLLLCGQTGVGKTSLLFLLAVELRESGLPVLFIPKTSGTPVVDQIDTFIRRLEDAECFATTIVIWDGLLEPAEYQKLSQSLASLGRKALVVGTCHDIDFTQAQPNWPSLSDRRYSVLDLA